MSTKDRTKRIVPVLKVLGTVRTINSQSIRVNMEDLNGDVLHCSGTVNITDGGAGYAKGCVYIKTDVVSGTSGLYNNKGTNLSCAFAVV